MGLLGVKMVVKMVVSGEEDIGRGGGCLLHEHARRPPPPLHSVFGCWSLHWKNGSVMDNEKDKLVADNHYGWLK